MTGIHKSSVPRPDLEKFVKLPEGFSIDSVTDEARRGVVIRVYKSEGGENDYGFSFVPFVSGPGEMLDAEVDAARRIAEGPVRLCCGQRHYGVQCPDGKVMCCMCFRRFKVEDLNINELSKKPEDVCKECARREKKCGVPK